MGMTCRPWTTAASAALSFGTNNPILLSALARRAIGSAPLTDRTPPVGYLPPHNSHSETTKFRAFQAVTELPGQPKYSWRAPPQEANRSVSVHDATGQTAWTWNHRYRHREMGEEPEPPDRIPPTSHH